MAEPTLGDVRIITLRVEDWAGAVSYYGEVLGLKKRFSDDPNEYAMFEAGSVRIAIEGPANPAHRRQAQAPGMMLNFQVEDLDAAVGQLKSTGAKLLTAIRQGPGYDYVAVGDPEGNEHIVYQRKLPT